MLPLTRSLALAALFATVAQAQTDPAITAWMVNLTGKMGSSPDATIHAIVSRISADVTRVSYTATDAYVQSTGVPSHPIGPWPMNPNQVGNQSYRFRIPRAPVAQTGSKTATGLGAIGVMANGVVFFNAKDARSWNNQGIWNQNANVVEGPGMDSGPGHPAPRGDYHYHQRPRLLSAQLCEHQAQHSPLLGFAFDGFPVYGAFGYASTNGSGGVKRIVSSYRLRSITTRTTLPNGTQLPPNQYGPPVSTQYPLGYYLEDFEYVAGLGDLDQYNGRTSVTPEYPAGTYAYFATMDASGNAAYPYLVGPSYFGVVATDNLTRTVTIPPTATLYGGGGTTCSGTSCGSVALAFSGFAGLGATLQANLFGAASLTSGAVLLGTSNTAPYPIDLTGIGASGCTLYQRPDVVAPLAFSGGAATLGIPIPSDASAVGAIAFVQGAALEPLANALGIGATQGGQILVRP